MSGDGNVDRSKLGPRIPGASAKRRWLICGAVLTVFVVGLGIGFVVPQGTGAPEAAHAEVRTGKDRISTLKSDLARAEESETVLAESLEEAERAQTQLVARHSNMDKRAKRLDQREAALGVRETELRTAEESPEGTSDAGPTADESPSPDEGFDRASGLETASDIVEDIKTIDERMQDGISVPSALSLLSDSYGRLEEAGTPPGLDGTQYAARLTTLQSFASDAADVYPGNDVEGAAKYAVIRKETGILLGQLNDALGTALRLP